MNEPLYCRPQAYAAFVAQLPILETRQGLLRAATAVAMHQLVEVKLAEVEAGVERIADRVKQRLRGESEQARLAHLHDELFEVEGFSGNVTDYYHPYNSYLPVVLTSRRGLPITLTLLYKCVAESIGLQVDGINAPGHFLARVRTSTGTMLVDPFDRGRVLSRDEAQLRIAQTTGGYALPAAEQLTVATHRQWLARLINNLQVVFVHSGELQSLAAMQELQAELA